MGAHTHPIDPKFELHFWVFYCFDFIEIVVGPGLQDVATTVHTCTLHIHTYQDQYID